MKRAISDSNELNVNSVQPTLSIKNILFCNVKKFKQCKSFLNYSTMNFFFKLQYYLKIQEVKQINLS